MTRWVRGIDDDVGKEVVEVVMQTGGQYGIDVDGVDDVGEVRRR